MKIDELDSLECTAELLAQVDLDLDPYHQEIRAAALALVESGTPDALYVGSNNVFTIWLSDGTYINIEKKTRRFF